MDNESANKTSGGGDAKVSSVKVKKQKQKSTKSKISSFLRKTSTKAKKKKQKKKEEDQDPVVEPPNNADDYVLVPSPNSNRDASAVPSVVVTKENNDVSTATVPISADSPISPPPPSVIFDDDELLSDNHQKLHLNFPLATKEEIKRFLNGKNGQYDGAYKQLQNHFQWRKEYNLILNSNNNNSSNDDDNEEEGEEGVEDWHSCASSDEMIDFMDWKFASKNARRAYNNNKEIDENDDDDKSTSSLPTSTTSSSNNACMLPQLVRVIANNNGPDGDHDNIGDKSSQSQSQSQSNHRILHLLPAQLDLSIASAEDYVFCIACYLEQKLNRHSMEKLIIVIDLRGGYGWSNPTPYALIPFIKQVVGCLEQNFPERLIRSIVFPMPNAAYMIWNMIKKLHILDPNTTEKIVLVPGYANRDSLPPYKRMEKLSGISKNVIDYMETKRCSSFC
jgi:hypothetical protein